jgi:hypothetical protein
MISWCPTQADLRLCAAITIASSRQTPKFPALHCVGTPEQIHYIFAVALDRLQEFLRFAISESTMLMEYPPEPHSQAHVSFTKI